MQKQQPGSNPFFVPRESLVSVLGVVYVHSKTSDGGDIYLTRFGLAVARHLQFENWYEREWFEAHREPLRGTGSVFRLPTKPVDGQSIELVVKNCRVGEYVPLDTQTLLAYVSAEFNSPWEEFSLVMEMKEGEYGPSAVKLRTQDPLAIYVPPDRLQLWQTGRLPYKIERIMLRHPGIDLDILRQYKMVYGWIHGKNAVEISEEIGLDGPELEENLGRMTTKATTDLEQKGFVVADMKPVHIILDESDMQAIASIGESRGTAARDEQLAYLHALVARGDYSIIDYELLSRTEKYEEMVRYYHRHSYLEDQRDRFIPTPLPPHLTVVEILGVPYVHGHVESTGGQLWVAGRNSRLFDFFLPERWRTTINWKLAQDHQEYYTVTKDNVHIIWKTSRVGETALAHEPGGLAGKAAEIGFNSPFEEFAIAQFLGEHGVPTVNMRAIYCSGSEKLEESTDLRRYESHRSICNPHGRPILDRRRNYVCIRGYYNGPDTWVAQQKGELCRRIGLVAAVSNQVITPEQSEHLLDRVRRKMKEIGCDGSLLTGADLLLTIDPGKEVVRDADGEPEARICNFELIARQ